MPQKPQPMYARHKLKGSPEEIGWLRENNLIAIHWKNSTSTNKEDYGNDGRSRGYQEIDRMKKVANSSRPFIVGAYYGKVSQHNDPLLVGRIDPSADVHFVHCRDGRLPVKYESPDDAKEHRVPDQFDDEQPDPDDDDRVYKALPLVGCQAYDEPTNIHFADCPLLLAVQPRHHSFCKWHAAKAHLRAIDRGHDSLREAELSDLSDPLAPSQLEVVCNEWLRIS